MTTTETASHYDHLERMSVQEILTNINKEDHTVPRRWKKRSRRLLPWWSKSSCA